MNFLSHLYLSGKSTEIIIGNFIGDFVKGAKMNDYPSEISKGIKLHREIDFFTDNHPVVLKSKDKLRAKHGHYAGVVVDMFYDHFLAVNWDLYHPQKLKIFADNIYALLQENIDYLPPGAQHMLPYMIKDNWLVSYADIKGIDKACKGIASRTKFASKMETATLLLEENYDEFKKEFESFLPVIKQHSALFLIDN